MTDIQRLSHIPPGRTSFPAQENRKKKKIR